MLAHDPESFPILPCKPMQHVHPSKMYAWKAFTKLGPNPMMSSRRECCKKHLMVCAMAKEHGLEFIQSGCLFSIGCATL